MFRHQVSVNFLKLGSHISLHPPSEYSMLTSGTSTFGPIQNHRLVYVRNLAGATPTVESTSLHLRLLDILIVLPN